MTALTDRHGATAPVLARGVYTIQSRSSGKVLDLPGFSPVPGTPIVQWDANGGLNQRWELVPLGGGRYHIVVQTPFRQLLAVGDASLTPSRPVVEWPLTHGPEQEWRLIPQDAGCYAVINRNSGQALDVFGKSPLSGTPVVQFPRNGGHNQHWRFIRA